MSDNKQFNVFMKDKLEGLRRNETRSN